MSACGIRQPENYHNFESPKIAIHRQNDDSNSMQQINTGRPPRKDESHNGMKLPPKPQVNPNNNINYRLPPRPIYPGLQPNQGSNRSFDPDTNRQR